MQNKKRPTKRTYVQSGIPGHSAPGGRKASKTRQIIQLVIITAIVLMVCFLAIFGLSKLISRSNDPKRLTAHAGDNIQAFGDNVLSYDGMTLNCYAPNGTTRWSYQLGMDGDYSCTKNMVVGWSGNQVHVLNKDGIPTFADRMNETIKFARVGESYVAICIGTESESIVSILTHTGSLIENLPFSDLYVIDSGFFSAQEKFVWVLALDIAGNAPISSLSTYEPGQRLTGKVDLDSKLVYRIYLHNNMLMLTDTNKITPYNYRCVEQVDQGSVLIYGWHLNDVRSVGKTTYALLQQMQTMSDNTSFSELRLVENNTTRSLRLLSPCFASCLSEKGVYAFGSNVIYFVPYGSQSFKATYLTYTLTDFICVLDGGRAVLAAGNDVFILKLPT